MNSEPPVMRLLYQGGCCHDNLILFHLPRKSLFRLNQKKKRRTELSYLHSSSIKDSERQKKGGMSSIVWWGRDGTGWDRETGGPSSRHLKASPRVLCGQAFNMQCTVVACVHIFASQFRTGNSLKTTAAENEKKVQFFRFTGITKFRFHPTVATAEPTGPSRG